MRLPPCPTCRAPLQPSRLLQARLGETRVAAGVDATAEIWEVSVSCPGCLAAIALDAWMPEPLAWTARETCSSAAVTRIRDRLAMAREKDTVERELRGLFSNPSSAWLLGTPELFEFVREAFGRTVTLRTAAIAFPGVESPGGEFPPPGFRLFVASKPKRKGARPGPFPEGSFPVPEGAGLALTAVREGALACEHQGRVVLAGPDLVAPPG